MKRTMKKTLTILLTLCALAAAQDKPKVAVYVTDGGDKSLAAKILAGAGAHAVVGEALVKAINLTGKGNAVNMTKEIQKEFGATVGAAQAGAVAGQFGVQSLCVVTISGIKGKAFNLGVKMFDGTGRETASGGPANVDVSNPAGILTAMTSIATGLVSGLALNAVKTAVTGQPAQAAAPPPAAAAPVAVAASPAPAVQYAVPAAPAAPVEPPPPPAPKPAPQAKAALPMHERPWVAVYARGRAKDDEVKAAFGPEMLFALARSGRYRAIESNTEFAAKVSHEAEKFGVHSLTDRQIALIAGGANADFICVVDVAPVLGSYQVFARIVNVKTLDAAEMGKAIGKIVLAEDIPAVADKVVESMFGAGGAAMPQIQDIQQQVQEVRDWVRSVEKQTTGTAADMQVQEVQRQIKKVDQQLRTLQSQVYSVHPKFAVKYEEYDGSDNRPRYLRRGISIQWGVGFPINSYDYDYYDYNYGYGYGYDYDSYDEPDFDAVGIGTHFNLDLIYLQIFAGVWTVGYADAGILLKVPVGNDYFKWYPLFGASINSDGGGGLVAGSRVEIGMGEITYATSEYLYSLAGFEGSSTLKSYVGWDIGFGEDKKGFFRPELGYSWIVTPGGEVTSRMIWELRAGLGYKWTSKKRIDASGPDYY